MEHHRLFGGGMAAELFDSIHCSSHGESSPCSRGMETQETVYSGKGNIMIMAQIEDRVNELKQGDKSVMEYVAELQHLWADLGHTMIHWSYHIQNV